MKSKSRNELQHMPLFSPPKDCGKITQIYPSIYRDMINNVNDCSIFMTINCSNGKKGRTLGFISLKWLNLY